MPATAINKNVEINTLLHLKKLAKTCLSFQLIAAPVYLLGSLVFPESNSLAVNFGFLAIIISLTPIFYALYKRHFPVLFSSISAFNVAPIWFLYKDTVLPGSDTYIYSPPLYKMEALFWVALFQVFVNLFYLLLWRKGLQFFIKRFSFLNKINLSQSFLIGLTFFTFLFPLIAFYFYYGSFDTLWLAATGGRSGGGSEGGLLIHEAVGGSGSYMMPINSFWQLTPVFGSIAFTSARNKKSLFPILSLLFGLIVVFVFFLGGSRGTMMFVAAPVLFFLFYFNWDRGFKFWVPATLIFFLMVGIMEVQVRFRGNLLDVIANPSKAAKARGLSNATTLDPTQAQQENNMYLFCLMIEGIPDKYPFEGFFNLYATLVNPIPRAVWPGKPLLGGAKDVSYQAPYILDGPLVMGTASLTFSLVGEAYLAGGFWGIIVYALLYALIYISFDSIIYYTKQKQVLPIGILGICVFLAFWGYRGFFALFTFLYPLLIFLFLLRMIQFLKRS